MALGIIQYKFWSGRNYVNDDDDDDDDDDNDDGSEVVDDGNNDDCDDDGDDDDDDDDDDDGGGCGSGGGDGGDDDDDDDNDNEDDDDGNNLYRAFRGVPRHFQALSPPPECFWYMINAKTKLPWGGQRKVCVHVFKIQMPICGVSWRTNP